MRSDFLSRGRRAGAAALARSAEALTRAGQIAGAGGHPRVALTRVFALAFVLALVTSAIAPAAAGAPATSSAALDRGPPDGMVGVPSDQVDVSAYPSTTPDEWHVLASEHAGTMDVRMSSTDDGRFAMVVADDVNHDERTVALRSDTLYAATGKHPQVARGSHSSGDRWSSRITYEDGYARFVVPKFSSNTVTFDGGISLDGNPADDGAQYRYDVSDLDAVGEFDVNITGVENTQTRTLSGSTNASSTETIAIGGNTAPTGPASGEPELIVTGDDRAENDVVVGTSSVSMSNGGSWSTTFTNPNPGVNITQATVYDIDENSATYTISIEDEDGNKVTSPTYGPSSLTATTRSFDVKETFTGDQLTYTINASEGNVEQPDTAEFRADYLHETENIDVSAPSGASASIGSLDNGETASAPMDLALTDDELTINGSGPLEWSLNVTERTETVDPTVEINGESVGYSGVLAPGTTTSLDVQESWIREGTNRINVSTSSPATGPSSQVGLDYQHTATTNSSVEYQSETWSESYNVSKTFASNRTDVSVTIPFASSRVVSVRDVAKRVDGGEWTPVDAADYSLSGTELTVELGDVNERVDVRANGSKVHVENGQIEVLDPTIEGNSLDSKIKIVEHSDGFAIDVGGTAEGNFVHYSHSESWTSPDTSTVQYADGAQTIRLPNARSGSSTRIASYGLEIVPDSGEVKVEMIDTDSSPEFKVDPRNGADSVQYRYHNTKSGDKYVLYSKSHSIARDTATAQSPVTLLGSFHTETLEIFNADAQEDDTGGTSAGGGGAIGGVQTTAGGVNPMLVLLASGALVLGLAYSSYRWSVSPRLSGGAATIVAILSLEIVSPGTISGALGSTIAMIGSALSEQVGFIVVLGLPFAMYLIYKWWQTRSKAATTPDTEVTFQLRGRNK